MQLLTYHGVVRGGTIFLDAGSNLPEGSEVVVTPLVATPPIRGTAVAVLAAMDATPSVPSEWVDEMERLIEEGRRPPTWTAPFSDRPSSEIP